MESTRKQEDNSDGLSLYESFLLLYGGSDASNGGSHLFGQATSCQESLDLIEDGYRHLPVVDCLKDYDQSHPIPPPASSEESSQEVIEETICCIPETTVTVEDTISKGAAERDPSSLSTPSTPVSPFAGSSCELSRQSADSGLASKHSWTSDNLSFSSPSPSPDAFADSDFFSFIDDVSQGNEEEASPSLPQECMSSLALHSDTASSCSCGPPYVSLTTQAQPDFSPTSCWNTSVPREFQTSATLTARACRFSDNEFSLPDFYRDLSLGISQSDITLAIKSESQGASICGQKPLRVRGNAQGYYYEDDHGSGLAANLLSFSKKSPTFSDSSAFSRPHFNVQNTEPATCRCTAHAQPLPEFSVFGSSRSPAGSISVDTQRPDTNAVAISSSSHLLELSPQNGLTLSLCSAALAGLAACGVNLDVAGRHHSCDDSFARLLAPHPVTCSSQAPLCNVCSSLSLQPFLPGPCTSGHQWTGWPAKVSPSLASLCPNLPRPWQSDIAASSGALALLTSEPTPKNELDLMQFFSSLDTTFVQDALVADLLPEAGKKNPKRASKTLPPCRICGETASGFHYGVNSCEACKGFYRRTLKTHRPHRCRGGSGQCIIKGGNPRKLCGYCRYKRCLSLGMSPEAIKPGRYTHTKRTQDTLEVLQLKDRLGSCLPSEREVEQMVQQLMMHDCHVPSKAYFPEQLLSPNNNYCQTPWAGHNQRLQEVNSALVMGADMLQKDYRKTGLTAGGEGQLAPILAACIEQHIQAFMKFAIGIPGFKELPVRDQISLIKHGRDECWLLGAYRGFEPQRGTFVYPPGTAWSETDLALVMGPEYAQQELRMAQRLADLGLTREEAVVLKTVCLVSSDRCTMEAPKKAEKLQLMMMHCLRTLLKKNHPLDYQNLLGRIMTCVVGLRDLTELARVYSYRRPFFREILDCHSMLRELVTCQCYN